MVLTPWTGEQPRDWTDWSSELQTLFSDSKWCPGVFVDDGKPPVTGHSLCDYVLRKTAMACVLCDSHAQRPFQSAEALCDHVRNTHQMRLCITCIEVSELFLISSRLPGPVHV